MNDNRTNGQIVKVTPELVAICYRKDGKTFFASMPSEHAEWAEEMLNADIAEVERKAAQKALTDAADELDSYDLSFGSDKMPPEGDWHVDIGYYGEANWLRARAVALGLTGEQEG